MADVKKVALKDQFSMMVILLIPIAIAINVVGGTLGSALHLPVDLDMIGVILVGFLTGPIPACITGVLTNLINGIFDPSWIPYAFVSFFIGISSGLLGKYGMATKLWKLIVSGLIIAIIATVTSAPITVFFFGGATGGGASMIAAGLMAAGQEIMTAVLSTYIVTESIGKIISVFVAWIIIKAIPSRTLMKYRFGSLYVKDADAE